MPQDSARPTWKSRGPLQLEPGYSISAALTVLPKRVSCRGAAVDDELSLHDHIVAGDDLSPGDLVYFQRIAAHTFVVRVLRGNAPPGRTLFRVEPGERTSRSVPLPFVPVAPDLVTPDSPRKSKYATW